MATDLSASPLAACRDLAVLLVDRAVVAAIARGWLDLDETLRRITLGAVARLDPLGETHDVVAAHLSRSTRWLHRHLQELRARSGRRKRPDVGLRLPADLGVSTGYAAMLRAASQLGGSPEVSCRLSVGSPRGVSGVQPWEADGVMGARLRMYVAMGVLREQVDDRGRACYRAAGDAIVGVLPEHRREEVGDCLEALLPLLLESLRGGDTFGARTVRLSASALTRAQERLNRSVDEIFTEALLDSRSPDEPSVEAILLWCLGTHGTRSS